MKYAHSFKTYLQIQCESVNLLIPPNPSKHASSVQQFQFSHKDKVDKRYAGENVL